MKIIREISHHVECFLPEGDRTHFLIRITQLDPQHKRITLFILWFYCDPTLCLHFFPCIPCICMHANRHEELRDPRETRHMFCIKKKAQDFPESPQRRLVFSSFVLFPASPSYCKNEFHVHLNTQRSLRKMFFSENCDRIEWVSIEVGIC